jgi:hypothetical protein
VELGVVVDVEFVGGWLVVIWDIVNDIGFHFGLLNGLIGLVLIVGQAAGQFF